MDIWRPLSVSASLLKASNITGLEKFWNSADRHYEILTLGVWGVIVIKLLVLLLNLRVPDPTYHEIFGFVLVGFFSLSILGHIENGSLRI